mmetsp:Transcript_29852/g.88640  ORF Transcript_29852/g.88640 Transcript_29852/m.88640 type:complete len:139 (+) Transcript_29852:1672-2088(+)
MTQLCARMHANLEPIAYLEQVTMMQKMATSSLPNLVLLASFVKRLQFLRKDPALALQDLSAPREQAIRDPHQRGILHNTLERSKQPLVYQDFIPRLYNQRNATPALLEQAARLKDWSLPQYAHLEHTEAFMKMMVFLA